MSFKQDAPTPEPVPETTDLTARRKAKEVRRRRSRGGRSTTIKPSRGVPQPAAGGTGSGSFGNGFGLGKTSFRNPK